MSISHTHANPAVRLAGSCGIASGVLLLAAPALPAPDRITHTLWLLGWLLLLGFFAGIATPPVTPATVPRACHRPSRPPPPSSSRSA
jgi:hypothetical protein